MNFVVKQFLLDCGEQLEYTSYMEMLPEEIITLIYRFVNEANIKDLSHPYFPHHPLYLKHDNGTKYHCNEGRIVRIWGWEYPLPSETRENIDLPPMSFGDLKMDCKKRRILPETITHKGVVFKLSKSVYTIIAGLYVFEIKYRNNSSEISYEINTHRDASYKKYPVAVPQANHTVYVGDYIHQTNCYLYATMSSRMLFEV